MKQQATYNTIDTLPVKRWFEILKTGHLHYLFVSGKGPVSRSVMLEDLWLDLQQQYFDEFGIDDNFKIRMTKIKRLVELNLEYVITGERILLNQINQLEAELRKWGAGNETSNYKVKDAIEKYRKYHIDLDKTTVIEWGYMVRDYEEAGRKAQAEQTKQKLKGRGRA